MATLTNAMIAAATTMGTWRTAEGEADDQVVDAERCGRQQQLSRLQSLLASAAPATSARLPTLPDRVQAGGDQQASTYVTADAAQQARHTRAQPDSDDGHERLEESECEGHAEPLSCIDARKADANASSEVAQAQREADKEQTAHDVFSGPRRVS